MVKPYSVCMERNRKINIVDLKTNTCTLGVCMNCIILCYESNCFGSMNNI